MGFIFSLNTAVGTYLMANSTERQIPGWNPLAGKNAYPMMMFELPASYDSDDSMSVLSLEANQVGFSSYYVSSGLDSPLPEVSPINLFGFTFQSNDASSAVYQESFTFSSSGDLFSGTIVGDESISFTDKVYAYEKTGPNAGVLSYTFSEDSFRYLLKFDSTNSGTYTKFADYGSEKDVTHGEFSINSAEQPDLSNGLVAWWQFEDGTGTIVSDSSGNGNNATFQNGAQWQSGKFGGGVEFDGSNDWVDAGQKTEYQLNDGFTLSAWVNPYRYSNWTGIIGRGIGRDGGSWNGALHLMIGNDWNSYRSNVEICSYKHGAIWMELLLFL